MLLKHIMVIFSLRQLAFNCAIIWMWSNYPLYFLSILKKWNLDRNIKYWHNMLPNVSPWQEFKLQQTNYLWSISGKCHFVQHYETLVGSRNIKNINLAHHSFHQLPSYLHWRILVVTLFFSFPDERKELIGNLCTWWRSLGTTACIARRPFQQNSSF